MHMLTYTPFLELTESVLIDSIKEKNINLFFLPTRTLVGSDSVNDEATLKKGSKVCKIATEMRYLWSKW